MAPQPSQTSETLHLLFRPLTEVFWCFQGGSNHDRGPAAWGGLSSQVENLPWSVFNPFLASFQPVWCRVNPKLRLIAESLVCQKLKHADSICFLDKRAFIQNPAGTNLLYLIETAGGGCVNAIGLQHRHKESSILKKTYFCQNTPELHLQHSWKLHLQQFFENILSLKSLWYSRLKSQEVTNESIIGSSFCNTFQHG